MLPRSTLRPIRAELTGLASLFPNGRTGAASVLFVVAHPGDEVIAAGGSFDQVKDACFLHVTDGSPRDLETAVEAGFVDRIAYAEARHQEFLTALECAGLNGASTTQLDYTANEISQNLAAVTMTLAKILRESDVDVVITHPYEGTHPDHDAIAFAVQAACEVLQADGRKVPTRIEAAGYCDCVGEGMVGEFLNPSFTERVTVPLEAARRRLKQCMLERMPIRLRQLRNVSLDTESFRLAPRYNFEEAPAEGILHYEKCGAGINGNRWRRMAVAALRVLGLAVG